MASHSNKKRPEKHHPLTPAIRFFKIILKNGKNTIKIPKKFTKMYGGGLSNPMFVKPQDGTKWKVYWTKHDGEFSFREGWKEFATYYSLGQGHLVVFEYKRNSDYFDVQIFDMSAVEMPSAMRFFQIIHKHENTIKIPEKFTKKYGGALSNPMFLKPPDGSEWKVYWTKHDGGISFQEGWNEFARHYSLDHGHLVMFKYEPNSNCFEVHIFDMSAVEIDYSSQDNDTDDDSIEILNEPPPFLKKREKSERDDEKDPNSRNLPERLRTKGIQAEERNFEMPIIASIMEEFNGVNGRKRTSVLINRRTGATGAVKEAKNFTTENPFFILNIKPNHLRGHTACISAVFIRRYLNKKKVNVKVQFEKKWWQLTMHYYPIKCGASFSAGWFLFAKETKLQAGDICIFELINRKGAVFDVHIFKGHN